jgi:hypothetical protein
VWGNRYDQYTLFRKFIWHVEKLRKTLKPFYEYEEGLLTVGED